MKKVPLASDNSASSYSIRILRILGIILITGVAMSCNAKDTANKEADVLVEFVAAENSFPLAGENKVADFLVDASVLPGVLRAVKNFQIDVELVSQQKPELFVDTVPESEQLIIIGTLGQSDIIDKLIAEGKLDVTAIQGKWEAYIIATLNEGIQGRGKTLVIAGSDMRGTIYGIYELSSQIGVSPWYWWADVPVKKHSGLYIKSGVFTDAPKVKYRGIFLNDEAPALTGWSLEKFGGFNHTFYEHVFELILRLKGNFLWPAMWGSAFYDDDTLNPVLANEYGVVIGTSHHEPLMRAHDEWRRYGEGIWNYEKNPEALQDFWRESIQERKDFEALITMGMRGDGDEAMTEGTAVTLLESIIDDQRKILQEEMGKDPAEIPQVWALYKEVQDYYNKGMQVPEDITLLLCDDNWGNVRVLPKPGTPERSGGYGMYYHFDFVGGPVSYRWLNVSPVSRTWEQMNLCWEHGVDRIWIVNVGDLKPMELPIDFFLDQAWNPERMTAERMHEYTTRWAAEQFEAKHAAQIAHLLAEYTRFNYRRTPEMLKPETYSLQNYREAERVVDDYTKLLSEAKEIAAQLPQAYQDAFYQLVMHPIEACSNLNAMYLATAKNHLYSSQGRASTNMYATKVKELFDRDAEIARYYHEDLAGGKWNHFMSQPHIGYTSWNNPPENIMPEVKTLKPLKEGALGVMPEGTTDWWPGTKAKAALPEFDNYNQQKYYLELFNQGQQPVSYTVTATDPWIILSESEGQLTEDKRVWVSIDWGKIPAGNSLSSLTISPDKAEAVQVSIQAIKYADPALNTFSGFVESNGYVSMEAEHFTSKTEIKSMNWQLIPEFGRTLSGMTVFPTTHAPVEPGGKNPCLKYSVFLMDSGEVSVKVYVAPSLNIYNDSGMKYATSFDDGEPVIYKIHEFDTIPDWFYPAYWNNSVTDNIRVLSTQHKLDKAGAHTLKLWMVTPGVVFEKIVIETAEIGDSYLGPPESFFKE